VGIFRGRRSFGSERLFPTKKTAQHLIAEVPSRQARVKMTIGIGLGDVWSHYCPTGTELHQEQLIQSANTNPVESNMQRKDNKKTKTLLKENRMTTP
jgi:diadenosine tetraphosphatase ApaH/serine/threonine PP2A family protein phosphatase